MLLPAAWPAVLTGLLLFQRWFLRCYAVRVTYLELVLQLPLLEALIQRLKIRHALLEHQRGLVPRTRHLDLHTT